MLREGLVVQIRVIQALFLREIKTRFGERRLGYIWAFLEPAIHIGIFVVIWKVTGRMGVDGIDPMLFLATGIIPYLIYTNTMAKVMSAIDANRALMIFPQVQLIDFVITRIILEMVTYFVVFWGFIFVIRLGGVDFEIEDFLGVVSKMFLLAFFAGSIGFLLIPLESIVPIVPQVMKIVNRAMYFTSGVFFSVEKMPENMKHIFIWNPLAQCIEMVRTDFFTQVKYKPEYYRWEFVLVASMIMFIAAFVLKRRFLKQIIES